jgi:8-oxo-dGTP diphosphatase
LQVPIPPTPIPPTPKHLVPKPCVGVVCFKDDQVLLIKRGRAPRLGHWSIPGGKVEWAEPLVACAARELFEETGIQADIGQLIEVYEIIEPEFHYVLIDYVATWRAGEPKANDDADEARFMSLDEALLMVRDEDLRDVLLRANALIKA